MDSFYGGKQGVSFVIKSRFTSIDEMVKNFKTGNEFIDVWYGEYCIIDTPNKNDKDNGKIYRRGMLSSINANLGGAEYIGQIVGPSSGTPLFQFGTLDNVINHNGENYDPVAGDIRVYPTQIDENGNVTQYNYQKDENGQYKDQDIEIKNDGSFVHTNRITTSFSTVENSGLIPGMEYVHNEDGSKTKTFHDSIKWTWCNIRKANENSDSWFYVGFQIPYLVNEFDAKSVNPYDNKGNYKGEVAIIPGKDNDKHPFYKKYTLGIPRGIKGDSLNGIKVITLSSDNQIQQNVTSNDNYIYMWNQFSVNNQGETYLSDEEPKYSKKITDNDFGRQIIVYEYRVTDKTVNGKKYLVYVGDFNVVEKINLSQDGTLKIYYTHDGIPEIIEGKKTGKFIHTQEEKLEWIQNIEINETTGKITLTYNTKDEKGNNKTQSLEAKLRNITSASINDKGNLNFGFNVGNPITVKDSNNKDFIFKGIQNVSLLSDLDADKHLTITYTTKTKDEQNFDKELIGSPINSIYSTAIDESNFHLLILFEDKDHRYNGEDSTQSPHVITKDETINNQYLKEGSIWVRKTISGENPKLGTDKTYWWLDLGSVKDDAGILVGKNITEEYLKGAGTDPGSPPVQNEDETDEEFQIRMAKYIAQKKVYDDTKVVEPGSAPGEETYWKYVQGDENNIINYLNIKYSSGITLNEYDETTGTYKAVRGKIVTYGANNGAKSFYAFDYDANTWYYLGIISASTTYDARLADANITNNDFTNVRLNGVISFYRTYTYDTTALPIYWN